jgi:hypothetical protein
VRNVSARQWKDRALSLGIWAGLLALLAGIFLLVATLFAQGLNNAAPLASVLSTGLAIAGATVTLVTWRLEHHPHVEKAVESTDCVPATNKRVRSIHTFLLQRFSRGTLTSISAMALASTVIVIAVFLIHYFKDPSLIPNTARDDSVAAIPGDKTTFVADVTIPDGSTVEVGKPFVKIWELQNSGTVIWKDRFLQRIGTASGFGLCESKEDRVPIDPTYPGQHVRIRVTLVAPKLPGSCKTEWKIVDAAGHYYFPHQSPLYAVVNVQAPDQN